MPEDCIFLLSFDRFFWGGGVQGADAGANRVGVIPFGAIENERLHKILQSFLKGHVFFCIPISILQKRNNKGRINNTSNIVFYNQNDGIPNQHNMVLAVLSPLKNKRVLLSITRCGHHGRELCRGVWGYVFQKLFKN